MVVSLGFSVFFYIKVLQQSLTYPTPTFFCDSTLNFEGNISLRESDLIASGYIVRVARNRVDGIRRALEVGLTMELRKNVNELIVVDGPLADKPFLMYGRLADRGHVRISATPPKNSGYLRSLSAWLRLLR